MILDLKRLYEIPGERQDFDYEISEASLTEYKTLEFASPVSVKGSISNKAGVVCLELTASYILHHECDRCLIGFEREYSFDMDATVVRSQQNYNDDYIEAPGDKLDLDEHVLSELLLHFPSKVLCKEDCKGLCGICGADLNESECGCQR